MAYSACAESGREREDVDVTQPTQLDPTEQDTLVKQIGLALLRVAPPEWEQVSVYYRAVGRYHEMTAELTCENEKARPWTPAPDIAALFARLRSGMYREGRGTWFNARYQLDRPSSYNLEYDRDEPHWNTPPPAPAFADELRMFQRDEENVPEWLSRRVSAPVPPAVPPTPPGGFERPRFRVARTFDGMGPHGRPIVNRSQLDEIDTQAALAYLDDAPVVMPSRGYDVDRLDPEGRNSVPIAFHCDGTWIWPASVNYYLRTYGVSPEPDLVDHIRRQGFDVPEVDEPVLTDAAAFVSRGAVPNQPPPNQPPPNQPPPNQPQQNQLLPNQLPPNQPQQNQPQLNRTELIPPLPMPAPPPAPPAALPTPPAPPAAPPCPPLGPALGQVRAKFAELGVPESTYRIGSPVERTWTLERVDDGWRVGWFERDQFASPRHFEDVADASAFLLGKVLLEGQRRPEPPVRPAEPRPAETVRPEVPKPPPLPKPPPPPPVENNLAKTVLARPALPPTPTLASLERDEREPVGVSSAPLPEPPMNPGGATAMLPMTGRGGSEAQTRPQDWPIQPLYGEPPLTLFRGKRIIEMQPGTEIDRFGDGDGNLTYMVGTPFPLRSLVPDWVNRSYHTYRVQQAFEALTGVAIPWFEQPGGGTAFLLPHAVEDMLEDGYLVEVTGRERPPLT
jgi:hypothetical protein